MTRDDGRMPGDGCQNGITWHAVRVQLPSWTLGSFLILKLGKGCLIVKLTALRSRLFRPP